MANDKEVYAAVAGSIKGFFSPADDDENIKALNVFGQAYQFITRPAADVRPNDKLTIDSVIYNVRGVSKYKLMGTYFLKCILEVPNND
ncbi:MAG: hypothetical protein E6R04_11905 [Spirochaetes bacterium]|nr:MAG: hypothetical protein E6R04_11905 [Spirochaetota bacterium]